MNIEKGLKISRASDVNKRAEIRYAFRRVKKELPEIPFANIFSLLGGCSLCKINAKGPIVIFYGSLKR
jgi:hypothetical protein